MKLLALGRRHVTYVTNYLGLGTQTHAVYVTYWWKGHPTRGHGRWTVARQWGIWVMQWTQLYIINYIHPFCLPQYSFHDIFLSQFYFIFFEVNICQIGLFISRAIIIFVYRRLWDSVARLARGSMFPGLRETRNTLTREMINGGDKKGYLQWYNDWYLQWYNDGYMQWYKITNIA